MRFYVEAYDKNDKQILGNLDGQGVLNAKLYRRTKHYKSLPYRKTLNNSVKFYRIVNERDLILETIQNLTYKI